MFVESAEGGERVEDWVGDTMAGEMGYAFYELERWLVSGRY